MWPFFKKKRELENLKELISEFRKLKEELKKNSERIEKLERENILDIKKIGLVRFNPFKEIGGNQSFSIALLDGNDNGVVITSLYTREGNRVYGKPIKNCQSEYTLSEEEKEAIKKAKSQNGK